MLFIPVRTVIAKIKRFNVRAYDLHDRKFGLAVSDGKVRFENIQLTTMGG